MGDFCSSCIHLLLNHRTHRQFLGLSGIHINSHKAGGRTPTWRTILYACRKPVLTVRKRSNPNSQDGQYHVGTAQCRMYPVPILDSDTLGQETGLPRR